MMSTGIKLYVNCDSYDIYFVRLNPLYIAIVQYLEIFYTFKTFLYFMDKHGKSVHFNIFRNER